MWLSRETECNAICAGTSCVRCWGPDVSHGSPRGMECEGRARHQSREQRVNDYVIKPLPWTLLEIPTARGKNMREITTLGILIFHGI